MRRFAFLLTVLLLIGTACSGDDTGVIGTAADPPMTTVTPTTATATTPTTAPVSTTTTDAAVTTTTLAPRAAATDETIFFVGGDQTGKVFNIFSIRADGSERTQLTDMTQAFIPNVSPDRTQVVFFNTDTGEEFVWVMDVDGANLTQITDYSSATADWHPSGLSLIMNSDSRGEPIDTPDVYHVALDGTVIEQLIDSDGTSEYDAHFTPDGSAIVFVSTIRGDADIYVMELASGDTRVLFDWPEDQGIPRISPDGLLITYSHGGDIYLFDVLLDETLQLTSGPVVDDMADWSPDGTRIVFASNQNGNFDLFTMDRFGGDILQVTDTPESELFPSWS